MKKILTKCFIVSLFIGAGALSGLSINTASAQTEFNTSGGDCSFCHYGVGCEKTSLHNSCDPQGENCSNDSTTCTPVCEDEEDCSSDEDG